MAGRPGRDGHVTAFFPPKQQSKQAGGGAGAGAADDTNAVRRKEVDVNGGGEQTRLGDSSSSSSSSTPSRTRVFPPHSLEFFRTVSPREPKRAKTKGGWGGASTHADKAKGPKSRSHRPAEPPIDRSVLGIDQKRVFDAIVDDRVSCFFTGDAGTGKSYLTRAMISALQNKLVHKHSGAVGKYAVAVTAPTGIAAAGIGGITLHSWAGIGLGTESVRELVAKIRKRRDALQRWTHAKVLIIDEVSMLDGHLFDKLDQIGRIIRKAQSYPFGGIQIVLAGDFWQLPPTHNSHGPQPIFCFQSKSWTEVVRECFVLTEIRRQKDPEFIQLLSDVRHGTVSATSRELLASARHTVLDTSDGVQPTRLYSRNDQANAVNDRELGLLSGKSVVYRSVDYSKAKGSNDADAVSKKFSTVPHKLSLKIGAQVLLLKNISPTEGLINGSRGVVVGFQRHNLAGQVGQHDLPVVRFSDSSGRNAEPIERVVVPEEWSMVQAGTVQVSRLQVPLRLAWAITIHKSQGMTISKLEVSLANVFEPGMAYVALSRGVSLEALRVLDFDVSRITSSRFLQSFSETIRRMDAESLARRTGTLNTASDDAETGDASSLTETQMASVGPFTISTFDFSATAKKEAPSTTAAQSQPTVSTLTADQLARMEENREKAQARRLARQQLTTPLAK